MKESRILHLDPEGINYITLPEEHQQQLDQYILEVDGTPMVYGWRLSKGTGLVPQWGIYWSGSSRTPYNFFRQAQECSKSIGELDASYITNPSDGTQAMVGGKVVQIEDINNIGGVIIDNVDVIRFDTPYAVFSQEKRGSEVYSGFMSWINHTDSLARFVIEVYGDNPPPQEDVTDLLESISEDWANL